MTVTENLGALGSWSLTLSGDAPVATLQQLGYFGHVAIFRGIVDVTAYADGALLQSARYVGVLREKAMRGRNLSGSGMLLWLGDEDHKGKVIETKLVLTAKTLTQCLTAVLPPAVTLGVVHDPGGTYTGSHQWQTPRDALDIITAAFGVEYRVNGDGTIDVGTPAQLYNTAAPDSIITAAGAGQDMDVQALGGQFAPDITTVDYSTRVVLLGQSTDASGGSSQFVTGAANAPTVPYKDVHGNTVAWTRMISDSGQTAGSVAAKAALQLNRFNRTTQVLKVTAADYEMAGNFVVGDACWVYDPDNGIVDPAQEITFRGEVIHPQIIRVSGLSWPVTEGHTVAYRDINGAWVDLTRWVVWETGTNEVTVGDLPKTLTSSSNPAQDRQDAAPDGSTPNAPTGLTLSSTSQQSGNGQATATLSASWTAPTLNTDGSVLTDLAYYVVQYRWHGRAPLWDTRYTADTTIDIPHLAVGLLFDVQVSAVDTSGNTSAPTAVASATLSADTTAPNPPSDPTVSSYLGQLRIAWNGKDNAGAAMPTDFAVVEVHVSATSGFTPDSSPGSATLVAQLATAGAAYATAPYGATRYVKLVAVDNSKNRSAPSGQVSGATVQAADGDIAALNVGKLTAGTMSADVVVGGRFATALTGGRVEMNSLGFQKFDTDGVTKLISLTGTEALLTGTYKTASSGRRIEIGSGGTTGEIDFYAPDGTQTLIKAYTETGGVEALQLAVPIASSTSGLYNRVNVNSDEWMNFRAWKHEFHYVDTLSGKGTGLFQIRHDTNRNATAGSLQFLLSNADTALYFPNGQIGFHLIDSSGQAFIHDGTGSGRLQIDSGATSNMWFKWASTNCRLVMLASDGIVGGNSPIFQLVNDYNYGANLQFGSTSTGTSAHLAVGNAVSSGFTDVWGGLYTNASSARWKTDIADFTGSARDKLRTTKAKTFRRKGSESTDGTQAPPGALELGLIAEETPEEVRTYDDDGTLIGIQMSALAALTLAYVQELDGRIDALAAAVEKGKP